MQSKRILVTGSNGQLGCEMRRLGAVSPNEYFFTDIAELDITDKAAVAAFVAEHGIEIIVNCAAYTDVDRAEEDEPTAERINSDAVRNLADRTVFVQMQHGNSSVMISAHENITVIIIHIQITSPHAADPVFIQRFQVSVRKYTKRPDAVVCDRIQKFFVVRNHKIRWICNIHYFSLCHSSLFHIQIINMNSYTVFICIGSHICNIFLLFHGCHSFLRKIS